jgi:hypothetical protein
LVGGISRIEFGKKPIKHGDAVSVVARIVDKSRELGFGEFVEHFGADVEGFFLNKRVRFGPISNVVEIFVFLERIDASKEVGDAVDVAVPFWK